ncbi:MAG TPA: hypothetical protein PLA94_21150, partial [Myxococcota bacterium]|nr:hypothetical protein [Myxococcota bacterium]
MYLIPLLTGCIPTDGSADALEKARQEGYEQALEEFEGRLNAVKSDLEGQIADVGAAAAAQSDLGGRVTDLETQMAVVQTDLPTLQNDVAALQSSAVTMIEQNVTYSVSTPAAFMQTLADLDHYQIAKDATVTIQLRDGTYYLTETVQIRHPDGDRIRIQ